jgi:mannose-6-phosphate isomerase
MEIPALLLLPANRVWRTYPGGKTLDMLAGKVPAQDSHFAEDWIASTTLAVNKGRTAPAGEGYSKVELAGQPHILKELMEAHPQEILGPAHYKRYGANTQFLLKFLDSALRLHLQAHPTIPFAQQYLQSNSGKTEAYLILAIRQEVAEPYIYLGFQHPLPKEKLKQAVLNQESDTLLACFEKIPVRPGDVFVVPGGLPHAIGEGIFMIEIMEPTDFVVRLEFERGGYVLPEEARFMGRGVDFAMDMIDFNPLSIAEVRQRHFCSPRLLIEGGGFQELILIDKQQTACFSAHQLKIQDHYTRPSAGFHVGVVTRGAGIVAAGSLSLPVKKGDKFLVPYQTREVKYTALEELEIVLTFPPGAEL